MRNGVRRDELQYELIHNLVLETTRLGIQVKNLKMQVDSMSGRLDFDERRARALEGVVQYRPGAVPPLQPPVGGPGRRVETEAQAAGTPHAAGAGAVAGVPAPVARMRAGGRTARQARLPLARRT